MRAELRFLYPWTLGTFQGSEVRSGNCLDFGYGLGFCEPLGLDATLFVLSQAAQRFDAAGNKVGSEFIVNTHTGLRPLGDPTHRSEIDSEVVTFADGGFMVVWGTSSNPDDTSGAYSHGTTDGTHVVRRTGQRRHREYAWSSPVGGQRGRRGQPVG